MSTVKQVFPVTGMSCASCALNIEKALRSQKGVKEANVNYANANATVEYEEEVLDPSSLRGVVKAAGYDMVLPDAKQSAEEAHSSFYQKLKREAIVALVFSIPLAYIGMFAMDMPGANYIMWALATPVVFYPGLRFFRGALQQLRHKTANMDTLVAMSTGIAYTFSVFNTLFPGFWHHSGLHGHVYFEASAVVIAFVLLGKLLEERAKSNTSAAIKKLAGLQPNKVTKMAADGTQVEVSVKDVVIDDVLLARPGERIAVDGEVTTGTSWIDESMITGESMPVEKAAGSRVFAGTINQSGTFQYKASGIGAHTLLAHIIRMVEEAQGSKAPVQKLTDKIAAIFVPVVIVLAALSFAVWAIWGGDEGIRMGFTAFVTVLVIACPCALGLATPTALIAGIGRAAENGILIKDARNLEIACKVNALALDKTGTITEGKPAVATVVWESGANEKELSNVLYSLETMSEHPLAKAIATYLSAQGATSVPVGSFSAVAGGGVTGFIGRTIYFAGNEKLLRSMNISIPDGLKTEADKLEQHAHTVIWLSDHARAWGIAALKDTIKPTSAAAVEALRQKGIEVHMLTGDNNHTATDIAKAAGIEHVVAGMSPTDKANYVRNLQQSGKVVAMAGDGINDSQALATADVSIAMGHGTDIAMDVAGITIISSELSAIPKAIELSRKTAAIIRQNLFWAFFYNVIGIPIAAGVLYPFTGFMLDPMIAGAAMALSSVSVVSNSLRLRWARI